MQNILNRDLPNIHLRYLDDVCVYNRRLANQHLSATGDYDFLNEIAIQVAARN